MNPKVDFYFEKNERWNEEITLLRQILLDLELAEELKWGCPCYTYEGDKIVLIHVFKEYCAILFFKGVLLKDAENLLIQQTENVQSARQMRFTSSKEIKEQQEIIITNVYEAIEVEKAGLKVEMKKTKEYDVPEEFQVRLDEDPSLKKAFESLTPGRQRAYLLYFSSAKQSKTRSARVEKYIDIILDGKGLND